jgi:hypothetical protein
MSDVKIPDTLFADLYIYFNGGDTQDRREHIVKALDAKMESMVKRSIYADKMRDSHN